jgi:ATP-dependent DNA helicase RecQ
VNRDGFNVGKAIAEALVRLVLCLYWDELLPMGRSLAVDANWSAVRTLVLERDGYRCVECGVGENLHVHHLVPRHLGGPDEPANLITLCAGCHAVRHPTLQAKLARRLLERWAIRLARLFDQARELPAEADRLAVALRVLGKERFREGQLDVVLAALRGESVLVVRPTGSGKTLCFQVPALLRPGTTFVFSPLKALMADQVRGLQRAKIPSTFINSDLDPAEKARRYDLLERGVFKLLYLTPERFDPSSVRDLSEIERLLRHRPPFLVVDEAHCVDRWGRDFRPAYGRLAEIRRQLGNPPVLAFTATAGVAMQKQILHLLGIPQARVIVDDIDRPNIALIRYPTRSDAERYPLVSSLVNWARQRQGKALLFVPTRRVGEEVQAGLRSQGLELPFYHGQLPAQEREDLLGRFSGQLQPVLDALICTSAFGMGLDIPNIRVVIHWVQPESVEDYVQEFGRAGRDGQPALAVIFKADRDTGIRLYLAERTVEQPHLGPAERAALLRRKQATIEELDRMIRDSRRCFRQLLRAYFQGEQPRRRSWILHLLDWLLGERQRVQRAPLCCDHCQRARVRAILERPESVLG